MTLQQAKKHLTKIQQEIEAKEAKEAELWKKYNEKRELTDEWNEEREGYWKERSELQKQLRKEKPTLFFYKNRVAALENGGDVVDFEDKKGLTYVDIPNFRKIPTETIDWDTDTILSMPKPSYIPAIDEEILGRKGFVFDAMKIAKDTYLLATNNYSQTGHFHFVSDERKSEHPSQERQGYLIVSLDQMVLTADYYFIKAKAIEIAKAAKYNKRAEERWDNMPEEQMKRYFTQSGRTEAVRAIYRRELPAKKRKQVTEIEWMEMTWQERSKVHKFYKRTGVKRLKTKLQDNKMWGSFHFMYERFIDPTAIGEIRKRVSYADPAAWAAWAEIREYIEYKVKDLREQRKELSDVRLKAIETSFGFSNTKEDLKEEFGVLVKRQNGSVIQLPLIQEIREGLTKVYATFGNLTKQALADQLKISHAANTLIFARKAQGVFVPSMGTIGVSAKHGAFQFQSTLAHEIGHWIDRFLGLQLEKRWMTDDYDSLAGQIAFTLRRNMNAKSDSDYINSTKECFARAMQMYFAVENFGYDDGISFSYGPLKRTIPYIIADHFVSQKTYENKLKPLIQQFLGENKPMLEGLVTYDQLHKIADKVADKMKVVAEEAAAKKAAIQTAITGMQASLAFLSKSKQVAIQTAITGMQAALAFL